jgi:hypothetical protein
MLMHKIALAGVAAVALTCAGSPAFAFTHHPATPAEIQATDDLNAKALADARTGQPNQPTASVSPQPMVNDTSTATTPSPDTAAPMPAPSPTAPSPSATGNGGVNTPDTTAAPPAATAPEQPEPPANGQ